MTASGWWPGTSLVAARSIRESFNSKVWRITAVVLLLVGLAVVIVPRMLGNGPTTFKLATVGQTAGSVTATLQAAAEAGGFRVEVKSLPDTQAAIVAVRDGDVDAALTGVGPGDTLYVTEGAGAFPALISQAAVGQATSAAMLAAGLSAQQVASIQTIGPPRQQVVGRVTDNARAGVGTISGIVLYLFLLLSGVTIAGAVAIEKTSRISEVLLAVLRPTQLLVGTVIGVGVVMLIQIAALAIPSVIGIITGAGLKVPTGVSGDIALAVVWFLLGLALYAFVFAALGALVEKPTEVGAVTMPASAVLVGSYLLGIIVATSNPNGWVSVVASMFPLSAPLVMPIRWASGLVPIWQLLAAMGLTALAAVGMAVLGARMYARGLTLTGRRLKVRDVITSRT